MIVVPLVGFVEFKLKVKTKHFSLQGTTQIVCCADEKPKRQRRPHTPPPNQNTDFVFE